MGILKHFRLDDKVALVTGAARGLGQGMALGLAEAGADIVALDIQPCAETLAHVRKIGRQASEVRLDLSGMNAAKAQELIGSCAQQMGRIDILLNNAGIIRRSPALEFSEADWQQVLDINLNSVFYLSQAAANHFVQHQQGGKIINLASMLSFQGGLTVPSYTAAKSAIVGLTRALANEWAAQSINVNALAPGYLVSEVTAGIRANPQRNQAILNRIPAGRWGEPNDLKGAAVFLASAASNYVHGTVLPVDGGWLAR